MSGIDRRRLLAGGLAATVVAGLGLSAGACSDDPDSQGTASPDTSGDEPTITGLDLPENDPDALRALFDPMFAPLGERVTRVGLYDLDAGFVADDHGRHLAIYVEPIDDEGWDPRRYIETMFPGAAAVTPFAFAEWSDLDSIDVCQEPPEADAPGEEPPIMTQYLMGRADAGLIDWEDGSLVDLIAAAKRSPHTARAGAHPDVRNHPAWVAADDAAEAAVTGG